MAEVATTAKIPAQGQALRLSRIWFLEAESIHIFREVAAEFCSPPASRYGIQVRRQL